MAYTANVPQATDRINDTQNPILENFQDIQTLINVNHGTFGAADQGKHKWVTFPRQADAGAGTGPDTSATTDVALFAKAGTDGNTQLFYRVSGIAVGGAAVNLTQSELSGGVRGWAFLPSGRLLAWGQDTQNGFQQNISMPATNFPGFSTIYSYQLTPQAAVDTADGVDISVTVASNTTAATPRVNCFRTSTRAARAVTFNYWFIGAP